MTTEIKTLIEQLTGEIAVRQDAITALNRLNGAKAETLKTEMLKPAPITTRKLKPRKANHPQLETRKETAKRSGVRLVTSAATTETGGATSVVDKLDKPDSIGGAMKYLIRQEPNGIHNTDTLLAAMRADADFAKLVKEDKDKYAITNNLNYWCKTEKIRESGDGFVVNRTAYGFFGIEA